MNSIFVICIFGTKITISLFFKNKLCYIQLNSFNNLYYFIFLLNNIFLFYNIKFTFQFILYYFIIPISFFHLTFSSSFLCVTRKIYNSILIFNALSEVFFYFSRVNYKKFFVQYLFKSSKCILVFYKLFDKIVFSKIFKISIDTGYVNFNKIYSIDKSNIIDIDLLNLNSKFLFFFFLKKLNNL